MKNGCNFSLLDVPILTNTSEIIENHNNNPFGVIMEYL